MAQLVREGDDKNIISNNSKALRFADDGSFKRAEGSRPKLGCGFLMGNTPYHYWQTTEVTAILVEKRGYIKFTTLNSTYEWWSTDSPFRWCSSCKKEVVSKKKLYNKICDECRSTIE
jgi:hypothetical protein